MAERWAFLVALDRYAAPELATPYAEAGASALAEALVLAGVPRSRQVHCFGTQATRLRLEIFWKRFLTQLPPNAEILLGFSGHGHTDPALGPLFLPWDTLPDALELSGLAVVPMLASAATHHPVTVFYDVETKQAAEPLDWELLPKTVTLFQACESGEVNHATPSLKSSLWLHLVTQVLSGKVATTATDGQIRAESLQRYLKAELPRLLRRHLEGRPEQSPGFHGPAERVVREFSADHPVATPLDTGRLKRVVFRADTFGKVKELAGFRKGFSIPENTSASNRRFIAKLATADLKADLDAVWEECREEFGYKRRDADISVESDGFGFLRGPDFEYTISVQMDTDDPSRVVWRREISQFTEPSFVQSSGFAAVFGHRFDELVFEFETPVNVSALVDQLEDRSLPGVKVHVGSDPGHCEVQLSGFVGRVRIDRGSLRIRGRSGDPAGLLEQFFRFLQTVGPLGEPLALPG